MEIIISNNSSKPIYEQITSQMKSMIMNGQLQAGDAIPSMRALSKRLMRICRETDLSKQLSDAAASYPQETEIFIRKSSSER